MRLYADSPQTILENNCAPARHTDLTEAGGPAFYKPNGIGLKINAGKGNFSFFSKPVTNNKPCGVINVFEAYEMITSTKYASQTRLLRAITDKDTARNYKARSFDYCCFSGIFSTRSAQGLITHSGFLTIDFDHLTNICHLKNQLIKNNSFQTVLAFTSPSGDGLKWIIEIDIKAYSHLEWFNSISAFLKFNYHVEPDRSGKDVSRCCFLPYDPEAYINPELIIDY